MKVVDLECRHCHRQVVVAAKEVGRFLVDTGWPACRECGDGMVKAGGPNAPSREALPGEQVVVPEPIKEKA